MQLKSLLIFFFCLHFLSHETAWAQQIAVLDKAVTLQISNKPISDIFKAISNQTGAVFSYGQRFNANQITSIHCNKKPLRFVLNDLLKSSSCNYKVKKHYIIITCNQNKPSSHHKINGYILNAEDSSAIEGASVYIIQNKAAALTNNQGNFTISHAGNIPNITLNFAKENYEDTSLVLMNTTKNELTIYLIPKRKSPQIIAIEPVQASIDTSNMQPIPSLMLFQKVDGLFWKRIKKWNQNLNNISDTLFTNFSVSLVPKISTNALLAFNTVNKYALNLLVGYSKGIEIIEVGGLLNIDHGNVQYVQLAGIGNVVSGNLKGFQAAGLFNLNQGYTHGAQCAGFMNYVGTQSHGFQAAGFLNYCKQVQGVQTAGFLNITNSIHGAQLAGFLNTSKKVKGAQLAGFMNVAQDVDGAQLAGFMNVAQDVDGAQVAGFINITKNLKGIQIACFNIADSATGVPIGVLSFVKNGYHKLELWYDETQFVNIGFGTGVPRFYNLPFLGYHIKNTHVLTVGYGLGSNFKINRSLSIGIQASTQQMHDIRNTRIYLQQINRVFLGPQFRLNKKLAFMAGPTYNINIAQTTDPYATISYQKITPSRNITKIDDDFEMRHWLGFKVVAKFL